MDEFLQLMNEIPPTLGDDVPLLKIVLSCDGSTEFLENLLGILFARQGLRAQIHSFPLGALLRPTASTLEALEVLKADYLVLIPVAFALAAEEQEHKTLLTDFSQVRERFSARIFQGNYVLQEENEALNETLKSLNLGLAQDLPPDVVLLDLDLFASQVGRSEWGDQKFWDLGRLPCSPSALPFLARKIVSAILRTKGLFVKCLVVDLDQTLWPGILDESGPDGVFTGDMKPYQALQRYLREASEKGIHLVACTKNERGPVLNALARSEMILREKHFSLIEAGWENKVHALERIMQTFQVHPSQVVFLDDSAFERELIRSVIPEVIVPDFSSDPVKNLQEIERLNLLPSGRPTREDELRKKIVTLPNENVDEFLRDLHMKARFESATSEAMNRIVQLFQRANQFNLLTGRYSERELIEMERKGFSVVTVSLTDRLSDYGIVSCYILEEAGETLRVKDWVMSCRVFSRDLEAAILEQILEGAQGKGFSQIVGTIHKTERNVLVHDLYRRLGFLEDGGDWILKTSQTTKFHHHITKEGLP